MRKQSAEHQKYSIRTMFSSIATSYDLVNRWLSFGQDQRWRRRAMRVAQLPSTGWLLDVATGTGDMALLAKRHYPALNVTGLDLTPAMLSVAQQKDRHHAVTWTMGDGLSLPYPDETFDAVISVFMMRNVLNVVQSLHEQYRVVKAGGRVVCLDMTWPRARPISWLFKLYFFTLPPLLGGWVSGNQQAYRYLPRSVKQFLTPEVLAAHMTEVGLHHVGWEMQMLGTVAIHVGEK